MVSPYVWLVQNAVFLLHHLHKIIQRRRQGNEAAAPLLCEKFMKRPINLFRLEMKLFNKYNHYVTFVERYHTLYIKLLCLKFALCILPSEIAYLVHLPNHSDTWLAAGSMLTSMLLIPFLLELIIYFKFAKKDIADYNK